MIRWLIKLGLVVVAARSLIWWRRDSRAIKAARGE